MGKTKLYTSGFLIVFLMVYTMSLFQPDSSTTYLNSLNLSTDDDADSWTRKIKSGPQLYSSSMVLIDNNTYVIGSIGEYYTNDDIYIAKFDSSGVKLWEQIWGGPEYDFFYDYVVDSENNIYIVGITSNHFVGFYGSIFLLKYNTIGNLLWFKTIAPFNYSAFKFHSIEIDLNESIFISSTGYNSTNSKTFITKINTSGNIFWTEEIEIGGEPSYLKTQLDSVGNIYLLGYSSNLFLLKLNRSGSRQWSYEWGEGEYGNHMKLDLEDNIMIIGVTFNEIWIAKINSSGNLTGEGISITYTDMNFKVRFLDSIFILTNYFLYEYNYSLDSMWKFPITNYLQVDEIRDFNFDISAQHEVCTIYYTYEDINILRFNRSEAIISNFKWGGSYYIYPPKVRVDSQSNFYILCSFDYENFWKERFHTSFLFKNPKSGDKPQIVPEIDVPTIFIFSLLGVMCVISVILLYKTLKPQSRSQSKIKSKVVF